MQSKSVLRQSYRSKRVRVPLTTRLEAADLASVVLRATPFYQQATRIAIYQSYQDEFITIPFINMIIDDGKQCYLPILTTEKSLVFVEYHAGDALAENRYGIKEPVNRSRQIDLSSIDIIIMPLVAFDKRGHRLGTGGGYYDRTLAVLKEQQGRKPLMLGLGYCLQETENVPVDPWDIPMDGVITEDSVRLF